MNRIVWDYLERKMGGEFRRRDYRETDSRMDRRGQNDSRRGMRDSRNYGDNARNREDMRDYNDMYDYVDGHDVPPELSKADMSAWKHALKNADGSKGAHYDTQQVIQVADKIGVRFDEYDVKEFCMTVNMMYSDYCAVLEKYVQHDKMLMLCADLAKAFLEDEDAPEGPTKLALYYHCIASGNEF